MTVGRLFRTKVVDSQMIDVSVDHLCYGITDRKTPWHLPYSQDFQLLSKIIITHVAKSKCKLAIYTKVDWASWAKPPRYARGTSSLYFGLSLLTSRRSRYQACAQRPRAGCFGPHRCYHRPSGKARSSKPDQEGHADIWSGWTADSSF